MKGLEILIQAYEGTKDCLTEKGKRYLEGLKRALEIIKKDDDLNAVIELGTLLQEIEKWSGKYKFSFQFWPDQNNVYISKDGVDLTSFGGYSTIKGVLVKALEYIYRINRTPLKNRAIKNGVIK